MNAYLEKLIEKHNLPDKDRHEIRQIYSLLPMDKQRNLIANFDVLASKLKQIEDEINSERDILIGRGVDNVRDIIEQIRKDKTNNRAKIEISDLKKQI